MHANYFQEISAGAPAELDLEPRWVFRA